MTKRGGPAGVCVALVCALVLCVAGAARAAPEPAAPGDLEARFLATTDAALGALVRDGRSSFAGAVLIDDGRIAAAPMYGVEDPGSRAALTLDGTLMELSSLRKLFIAVAVAQLIDRGVVASVDDPINRYLIHFKLPRAVGRDVTIRDVATHTAGFDEMQFGAGALAADPAGYFKQRFPGYFAEPGRFSSYDTYGPQLLAFMVAEVSGMPFTRYVQERILEPLAMHDTYLVAPPEPLAHRIAAFQPASPGNVMVGAPLQSETASRVDGEALSTMADMAKFAAALLGAAPDRHVVTPAMRALMFQVLHSNGDGGSAHGLLFDAVRARGTTLFVHGGFARGAKCMMALELVRQAGIFYCYGDVRRRFDRDAMTFPPPFEQVSDAMLEPLLACRDGSAGCADAEPAHWNEAWRRYIGLYVATARHHHGFSQLRTLLYPTVARIARAGEALSLDGVGGYVEIRPGVFANPRHLETFAVVKQAPPGRSILSISDRPSVYEHVATWSDDPRVLPCLIGFLVCVALTGGLLVLFPAYGIDRTGRIAAALNAAVAGGGVAALFGLSAFGRRYFDGVSWPLDVVRGCAFMTVPVALGLLWYAARLARRPCVGISRWGRAHYVALALASLALACSLRYVGLLSFARIT